MATQTPELQSLEMQIEGLREISETLRLSESAIRILPDLYISESFNLSEETEQLFRAVSSSILLSESVTAEVPVIVDVAEFLSLSEEINLSAQEVLESVQLSEVIESSSMKTPILLAFFLNSTALESTDEIIFSEIIELKYGILVLLESFGLSEEISWEKYRELDRSDELRFSEILSVGSGKFLPEERFHVEETVLNAVSRSPRESIFFSEELSVLPCFIEESIGFSETVTRQFPLPSIEELLFISESAVAQIPRLYGEGIGLVEGIELGIFRVVPVEESLNLLEQLEVQKNPTDEILRFSDLAEAFKNLVEKDLSDTLIFSEVVQSQIARSISEILNLLSSIDLASAGSILSSEEIKFSEEINWNRITPSENVNLAESIVQTIFEFLSDSLQFSENVGTSIQKYRDVSEEYLLGEGIGLFKIWTSRIDEDLSFQESITKIIAAHIGPDLPIEVSIFEDLILSEISEKIYLAFKLISDHLNLSESQLLTQERLISEQLNLHGEATAEIEPIGWKSARLRFGGKKKKFVHLRKGG